MRGPQAAWDRAGREGGAGRPCPALACVPARSGIQIEEPFKVLPLMAICAAIESSVSDMEKQFFGSSLLGVAVRDPHALPACPLSDCLPACPQPPLTCHDAQVPSRVGDDPVEEARQISEAVDAHARLAGAARGR